MDPARLKSIALFSGLSDREREQVARWADEVDIKAGKHLVDQGRFAYEFFIIEEGTAEVTKNGDHLTDLGPGDFFGEIGILGDEPRTASVVASSDMTLIVMTDRDFREMTRSMPQVAETITKTMELRMKQAD
ncbi:MAG TPA: cyclic nucleotide-binding domain-containing protein [Actinomycetota bacterium]|jgi:CRP-like cAMP-binding protein|nr:cyclic nucleotide-binding domain-containing protein [Actinomycetota bacterium]